MGDSKKIKQLCEQVDTSIQSFYRYKRVKEINPELAEKVKNATIPLYKAYQEATGKELKTKRTVCLDFMESLHLDIAKDRLEMSYSDTIKQGLELLYKMLGI